MVFFNTRRKLKELEQAIAVIDANQRSFSNTYNGTVKYVDMSMEKVMELLAERRKSNSMSFKAEQFFLEPDYGTNLKDEETNLNKKEG